MKTTLLQSLTLLCIVTGFTYTSRADVSITASNVLHALDVDGSEVSVGTLGIVVIDTGRDGFGVIQESALNIGEFIGDGNDLIVHRVDYASAFGIGLFSLSQGGLSFNLDVSSQPGFTRAGDTIALCWFPGLTKASFVVNANQPYGIVQAEEWLVPSEGSTVSFSAINSAGLADLIVPGGTSGPVIPSPDEDQDNDGVSDFLEAAFGGNPTVPDRSLLPVATLGDADVIDLVYRQLLPLDSSPATGQLGVDYAVQGFRYAVETSTDLHGWNVTPDLISLVGTPVNNGDGTQSVTVRVTPVAGQLRGFVRLTVSSVE